MYWPQWFLQLIYWLYALSLFYRHYGKGYVPGP